MPRSGLDWLFCSCGPYVPVWVHCQAPAMIKDFRQTAPMQVPQAQEPVEEKTIPHCIICNPPSSLLGRRATPRPNTLTRGHTWIGPAKFCGALEQDKSGSMRPVPPENLNGNRAQQMFATDKRTFEHVSQQPAPTEAGSGGVCQSSRSTSPSQQHSVQDERHHPSLLNPIPIPRTACSKPSPEILAKSGI